MANIRIMIDDLPTRLTLKSLLESEGHVIREADPDVAIASMPADALAAGCPALLVATAGQVPDAVRAMRAGVFGYISLPLQPGEAGMMVRRALEWSGKAVAEEDATISLEEAERRHIVRVLRACKGNQVRAAKLLGIGRNTLWRKLKTMGEVKGSS